MAARNPVFFQSKGFSTRQRTLKPTHRRRENPMDIASVHAGAPNYRLGAGDGHEGSKQENVVELSNEERPVTKKRKLMLGNCSTRTRFATKPVEGGTSTFPLEDNPVDFIIRDLEGIRSWIAKYELQMQEVGELVGNPPRESLVAAIHEAI